MLARIVNMRGANLNVFTFDYDLTWAAFFMNGDQVIYGRFGGRDASSADKYLMLAGLKYAMQEALGAHRQFKGGEAPAAIRAVEEFPAAKKLKPNACIHCHQVWDFRREERLAQGTWKSDDIWVYPLPENIGVSVDPKQGNRVQAVIAGSPAARIGLRPGDVVTQVDKQRIASFADLQHALHLAAAEGSVPISWERQGELTADKLALPKDWRKTDISWRESMWGLEPTPCVYGKDLTVVEKRALGLSEKALAFRQGSFVPPPAQRAGVRADDIILGIDGKNLEMNMRQFNVWVRLNHRVGDRVTINLIRNGKRLEVPLTLPKRPF